MIQCDNGCSARNRHEKLLLWLQREYARLNQGTKLMSSPKGIKHTNTSEQSALLFGKGVPDVSIDFFMVLRTTGQAVIPCCVECRLHGTARDCPIAALVIDALDTHKSGRKALVTRAHFRVDDAAYQPRIVELMHHPELDDERRRLFFYPEEDWELAKRMDKGKPDGQYDDVLQHSVKPVNAYSRRGHVYWEEPWTHRSSDIQTGDKLRKSRGRGTR